MPRLRWRRKSRSSNREQERDHQPSQSSESLSPSSITSSQTADTSTQIADTTTQIADTTTQIADTTTQSYYTVGRVSELPPSMAGESSTPLTGAISSDSGFTDDEDGTDSVSPLKKPILKLSEENVVNVDERDGDGIASPLKEPTLELSEENVVTVDERDGDGIVSPLKEVTQVAALPEKDDLKNIEGNGIHVQPPKKTTNSAGVLKRMFSFVLPDGGRLTAALVSLIVSSSSNLALPYFVGKVVDRALSNGSVNGRTSSAKTCTNNNNLNFFIGAAGLFACGAMASYIRTYNFNIVSHRVGKRMREMLFSHLLRLDMSFYDEQEMGSGEFVHVLSEDVEAASKIYTDHMSSAIRSSSSAINGSIMLLTISPKLTLLSVGMVPAIGASAMAFSKKMKASTKSLRKQGALATSFANERLSGLRTVKAFAGEEADARRYKALLNAMEIGASQAANAQGLFMSGLYLATSASLMAVLHRGGGLVASGVMSVGSLMSFSVFTAMVGLGFSGVGGSVSDMMKGIASAERVFDILDEKLNISSNGDLVMVENALTPPIGTPEGFIKVENVYFSYPTRRENVVLNGLSLEICPGEMLALTGPSGGGKSTLTSLMYRLYEPQKGNILLDGVDIASRPPFWIRDKLAIVEQDPTLFSGSIHDNICYALPSCNFTDVMEAAKKANAHEFIMTFPQGYDTEVGPGGKQISGGQKTRIALARAFLKDAPLLIIDEATAHLDGRNEKLVQDGIIKLMANRTTLIIAHRRETVAQAKKVAVMEEGYIVQLGTYAELMLDDNGPLATCMRSFDHQ